MKAKSKKKRKKFKKGELVLFKVPFCQEYRTHHNILKWGVGIYCGHFTDHRGPQYSVKFWDKDFTEEKKITKSSLREFLESILIISTKMPEEISAPRYKRMSIPKEDVFKITHKYGKG